MSISLVTKGIISVSVLRSTSDLGPVPVCEPDIISYEYGERYMRSKELIPKIKGEEGLLSVLVCEPDGTSQKYGEKHIKTKELKPTMRTEEI